MRIIIVLTLFLSIGFYINVKDDNRDEVLIKDHHTSEMSPTLPKNPDIKQSKISRERPKEGLSLLIGKKRSAMEKELGKPLRIDESAFGYQWYIYNSDYARYVQVGVEDNRIVTVFAIGENLDVAPFEIGQPVEEIFNTQFIDANIEIDKDGSSYRFELNDTDLNIRPIVQLGNVYVQLYIDKFTGNLSSVRFLDADTLIRQRPYELVYSGKLIEAPVLSNVMWRRIEQGAEKQIFDLTNVLRVRHHLKPLLWDEKTAQVAYEHSKDMAENNDFSHTSKKFGSLSDRLKSAQVVYQTAGENIAANYIDGPEVVEGWLNSKGHRDSLLNTDFSHLGVGVYQKDYTQNFIQKWKQ
ncbi:CAP domain-containing protein [Neobacillus niacini]|uniref:CAP domain-containing protein n=1 Tax=Neobacillus niacini TaxID=86668 RepID=UPI002858B955|nr:CAP domain-containing protein [Neobacillus niacini]MDR6998033.1 uncharacterized protein YkwD [Neobacillus niacini]